MSSEKNVTFEQLQEFAIRADERLDNLEKYKADKASNISISIPVSAWTENTDASITAEGFAFCVDVAVEGLTEADSVDTILDIASLNSAKICGMANTATTMAGAIRYYAIEKPTVALTAKVRVFKAKST